MQPALPVRFKLADGKWHRFSIRRASLENAIAAACDMYDEARYRQRLGLAHRTHTFANILDAGINASANFEWYFDAADAGHRLAKEQGVRIPGCCIFFCTISFNFISTKLI
jgi:hypothetical protein